MAMGADNVYTVTQLTDQLRAAVEPEFAAVNVVGEISDYTQSSAGHLYFVLRDAEAQIRGVIWRSTAHRLRFQLSEGLEVLCSGAIGFYPPRGTYQLTVQRIEPVGVGAQQLALRQLTERLRKEGLFDAARKRPLPAFPQRIGVVTSPSGAALHDICQVIWRRWRDVELLVFPAQVQGEAAGAQLCAAIEAAGRLQPSLDVLIVARGGGSSEDLQCFNDEAVVRAVYKCTVPVVSAVGHEIDVTLCDLVADVRALTPSQAGEFVVPDGGQLQRHLGQWTARLRGALSGRIEFARRRVAGLAERSVFTQPVDRIHRLAQRCDELEHRWEQALGVARQRFQARLGELAGRLQAVSPLQVLARGYSLTTDARGRLLSDAAAVEPGQLVTTQLHHGLLRSRVESVSKSTEMD